MASSLVDYVTLASPMSVIALNDLGVVALNIPANAYNNGQPLAGCTVDNIKSVVLATANGPQSVRFNDEDCREVTSTGAIVMKTRFLLKGLETPLEHDILVTICFDVQELNYKKFAVKVLGDMDTPVITNIASSSDYDSATTDEVLLTIEPHGDTSHAKLMTDDIVTVRILVNNVAHDFEHSHTGNYKITGLTVGNKYDFSCFMINSTNNFSARSAVISYTVTDTRDVLANTLSHTILDDKDLRVNIAAIVDDDRTTGTLQEIADFRFKALLLRTFVVPVSKTEPSSYVPLEKEFSKPERFEFAYNAITKKSTLAASSFTLSGMNGRDVIYQAAMVNANGTGEWTAIERAFVPVATPPAPTLAVGADLSVSAVAPHVTGLQLLGIEYSTVGADDQALDYGAWSYAADELAIAGDKLTATVTLSAFNGILGNGEGVYPSVSTRSPVIKYVVDGNAQAKPYFKIRARGVYAALGELGAYDDEDETFDISAFTKRGQFYERGDSSFVGGDLKIHSNVCVDSEVTRVEGAWSTSETQVVTVPLAAVASNSITGPTISTEGNRIYATISMDDAEGGHKTFLAANAKSQLTYYVIDKKNPSVARVPLVKSEYDLPESTKLSAEWEIPRGKGHEYVLMGEVCLGADKIGVIEDRSLTTPIVQGADRRFAGMYTSDPAAILGTDNEILEHNASESAVFAIEYSGKFSLDNKMDVFDDSTATAAYTLTNFKSSDNLILGGDWVAVAPQPTVVRASKTHSKTGVKYFVFKVSGLSALKRYKCELNRIYTVNGVSIVDQFPHSIEFISIKAPSAPVFAALGEEGRVNASFESSESSLSAPQVAIIQKSLSGMRNDLMLYANQKFAVAKSSTEEEFSHEILGETALVEGARSYEHPKKLVSNGLESVDAERVSSASHGRAEVNLSAGPAKLSGVSVKTVLANGVYSTKFMCDKPASGVTAKVAVSYDDESEENKDQRHEYTLQSDADDATKLSCTDSHATIQGHLGSLSHKNFLENGVRCAFTASTGSDATLRNSSAVTVYHVPNKASTLVAGDFKVEKLAGGLKVSTGKLSAQQLGGNATLQVKIVATGPDGVKHNDTKVYTLGASGLDETITLGFGIHAVSAIIQKSDLHAEAPIGLGNYAAGAALDAAKNFKVVAASATSLSATWGVLADLDGWTRAEQRLYVTGLNLAGKKVWHRADTSPSEEEAFFNTSTGASATQETLSGLPTGQPLTVILQAKYTKTGHADQYARAETHNAVCAAAPQFLSFNYRKEQKVVTALVAHNGALLKKFVMFAKYDGAAGKVLCEVSLDGADVLLSNDKSAMYSIKLPTSGPEPTGFLGFILNENGSDMHADPNGTFGGASITSPEAYVSTTHQLFPTIIKQ